MLRDDVVDQGHHNIETEQHYQPFTDEDGYRPEARDEMPHNKTLCITETRL